MAISGRRGAVLRSDKGACSHCRPNDDRLRLLSREMAVILVEQHIELALEVAQYAYVIDRGHVALEGPAATVKCDPQLIRYLAP